MMNRAAVLSWVSQAEQHAPTLAHPQAEPATRPHPRVAPSPVAADRATWLTLPQRWVATALRRG